MASLQKKKKKKHINGGFELNHDIYNYYKLSLIILFVSNQTINF